MVVNRDEALRALAIAERHLAAGSLDAAIRFANKSIALDPTNQARALLARAEALASSPDPESAPTASTSATSRGPSSAGTSSRVKKPTPAADATPAAASGKQYTAEQLTVVKRVKACRQTAYYEILQLEKTCSDGQVKKAYRKLALSLHPDKNLAPGAEEAFKMVSKAFQVLSDSNKRAIYDQTGGDPDSRGGGGGGGGGGFARAPFAGAGGGGGGFGGEDVSPEDLFRAFFGGGMGGGGMGGFQSFGGGGPFGGTTFQFYGPGGARMHAGGAGARQRRPGQAGQGQGQQQGSPWVQLAPLLLFFFLSLLTQLPSWLSSATSTPDPSFAFEPRAKHALARDTTAGTRYFVDPDEFGAHPLYAELVAENPAAMGFASEAQPGTAAYRRDLVAHLRAGATAAPVAGEQAAPTPGHGQVRVPRGMARFENRVNEAWVARLQNLCRMELNRRSEELDRARGFLGIGTDHARIQQLLDAKLPNCEALSQIPGYRVTY